MAFAQDSQSLLCIEAAQPVYFYHLITEKVIYHFDLPQVRQRCNFATFSPDFKLIALIGEITEFGSAVRQCSIFLYDLPDHFLKPPAAQVDDVPPEQLWADLSTPNELRWQWLQQALCKAPKLTVQLVRTNLSPVPQEQFVKVDQWIRKLGDPEVTNRDMARKDLHEAAYEFGPLLKARQEPASSGEIRKELSAILNQMVGSSQPAALVRKLRAVSVLEQIATPEALQLLTDLADGAPLARLTVEARAAKERLAKSKKSGEK